MCRQTFLMGICMRDIHTHILFDVDDGAKDIETSLKMLEMEKSQGVDTVVLTPHYKPERGFVNELVKEHFEELKDKTDMKLLLGNEMFFSETALEDLNRGLVYTVDGEVLVEFSPFEEGRNITEGCRKLYNNGNHIILAHIERYLEFDDEVLEKLLNMDVDFQMNARYVSDLSGLVFGRDRWYRTLLKTGLVKYVASDAHNMTDRKPELYIEKITRMFPEIQGFRKG